MVQDEVAAEAVVQQKWRTAKLTSHEFALKKKRGKQKSPGTGMLKMTYLLLLVWAKTQVDLAIWATSIHWGQPGQLATRSELHSTALVRALLLHTRSCFAVRSCSKLLLKAMWKHISLIFVPRHSKTPSQTTVPTAKQPACPSGKWQQKSWGVAGPQGMWLALRSEGGGFCSKPTPQPGIHPKPAPGQTLPVWVERVWVQEQNKVRMNGLGC